jgi:2-keto-4-pentenoate hydratase/2-oxohepta-3-ene-1,7-dioic acid hydratase in catechol pathway
MKLVAFDDAGTPRAGVWSGDEVAVIDRDPAGLAALAAGLMDSAARDGLSREAASAPRRPAADLRLLAPLPRPGKIICVGQSYWDHCREQNVAPPERPILFAKFNNAILPPGAPIRIPAVTDQIDYEAELALVIGKGGRNIPEEKALEHVAAYTCLNDVSARDIQFADKQWVRAKSFDTFSPIGPCLVTADEIPDPQTLWIRCTINGETFQDSSTSLMIFNCAFLIAFISQAITLEPGDLITTGTPDGVGFLRKPPRFLTPGDRVTISIQGIGELTNPVEG